MIFQPMQYKDYVWPHNPKSYSISFKRAVASDKMPGGSYRMQTMGLDFRVISGEGAFSGAGAYDEFKRLATVFYKEGAGLLIHPVWQPSMAHFVELELLQEPSENYVAYRFEFWEDSAKHPGVTRVAAPPAGTAATSAVANSSATMNSTQTGTKSVTAVAGDTAWSVAQKLDTTAEKVMVDNPQIRNPHKIPAGKEVYTK